MRFDKDIYTHHVYRDTSVYHMHERQFASTGSFIVCYHTRYIVKIVQHSLVESQFSRTKPLQREIGFLAKHLLSYVLQLSWRSR